LGCFGRFWFGLLFLCFCRNAGFVPPENGLQPPPILFAGFRFWF
jgi:hypothetical protein